MIRLKGSANIEGQDSDAVFRLAYLNSKLQTVMVNALDEAITAFKNIDTGTVKKQGEIQYDFSRKRLSVIVQE